MPATMDPGIYIGGGRLLEIIPVDKKRVFFGKKGYAIAGLNKDIFENRPVVDHYNLNLIIRDMILFKQNRQGDRGLAFVKYRELNVGRNLILNSAEEM